MGVLIIEEVRKTFRSGEVEEAILKGVSLSLEEGGLTALTGASGSGKSTLLTVAAGLQPASHGRILFRGEDLTRLGEEQVRKIRASQFGFVFQFSHLVPFLTVEEQLSLMLDVAEVRYSRTALKKEIRQVLELVGLEHRRTAYPATLSGGEKQRVAIARAIIHRPAVLFADEPTASLDSQRSLEVMELLRRLTKELKMATLMVTHEDSLLSFADRIVKMEDGMAVSGRHATIDGESLVRE